MSWTSHLLLLVSVAAATALSWTALSYVPGFPTWVPSRVGEVVALSAMAAPFVALGWGLDRLGVERPMRRVAVAVLPFLALAVAVGAWMGWGLDMGGRPAWWQRASDAVALAVIGGAWCGLGAAIGVTGAGVGAWLSRASRPEPPPAEQG